MTRENVDPARELQRTPQRPRVSRLVGWLVAALTVAAGVATSTFVMSVAGATTPASTGATEPAPIRPPAATDARTLWTALRAHCGRAYAGKLVEAPSGDTTFGDRALVMHVRACNDAEIRMPFHVGDDRSRTWVLTPTPVGFRLKHDHRHADGTEDAVTQYGGDSATRDGLRQEFRADAHTSVLIPAAATNVWTMEIVPGRTFVYALRREGTERRFRIEFDLTREVNSPPAPWGAE